MKQGSRGRGCPGVEEAEKKISPLEMGESDQRSFKVKWREFDPVSLWGHSCQKGSCEEAWMITCKGSKQPEARVPTQNSTGSTLLTNHSACNAWLLDMLYCWCRQTHFNLFHPWLPSFLGFGSLVAPIVKNLPAMQETRVRSLGGEEPWKREWKPTRVLLPGEYHGQRSLVGNSPWGCKESDKTERLTFSLSTVSIQKRKNSNNAEFFQ